MKKKLISLVAVLGVFAVFVPRVLGYEGNVELKNDQASCQAVSVWKESQYKIVGRCEGLVYPYQTQYEHYYAWGHEVDRDTLSKIGAVNRGYFEGGMEEAFDRIVITAEEGSSPRRPSDKIVLEGNVERFVFDKSEVQAELEPVTVPSTTDQVYGGDVPEVEDAPSSTGSVLGKIVRSILTIILIVVVAVIGASLLFRKRGSVSR